MRSRLLVFDIETIPDRQLLPEPAEGTAEPFPKTLYHQVIVLALFPLGSPKLGGSSDTMLRSVDRVELRPPQSLTCCAAFGHGLIVKGRAS